jgi:hypothetical protein
MLERRCRISEFLVGVRLFVVADGWAQTLTEVSLRQSQTLIGRHRDFGSAFQWDTANPMETVSRRLLRMAFRTITDDVLGDANIGIRHGPVHRETCFGSIHGGRSSASESARERTAQGQHGAPERPGSP